MENEESETTLQHETISYVFIWTWVVVTFLGAYTTFHLCHWLVEALPQNGPPLSWWAWKIGDASYSSFMGRVLTLLVSAVVGLYTYPIVIKIIFGSPNSLDES